MSQNIKDEFLDKVIEQIEFKPDRRKVRQELEDHIEDKLEYQSLEESIDELGNPIEIGESLNDIHNPFVGRLWILSRLVLIITIVVSVQLVYKELKQKNEYMKSNYSYTGTDYQINNNFNNEKYSNNGIKYTVQLMTSSDDVHGILFISKAKIFDLNFDNFYDYTIRIDGINISPRKSFPLYSAPDEHTNFFVLDTKLRGDETVELITNEQHFNLEGKLK